MSAVSPQEFWPEQNQAPTVTSVTNFLGALSGNPEITPILNALGQPPDEQAAMALAELSAARQNSADLATDFRQSLVMAGSLYENFGLARAQIIGIHILYLLRHPEAFAEYAEVGNRHQDQADELSRLMAEVQADGFEPVFNRMAGGWLRSLHEQTTSETANVEMQLPKAEAKRLPATIINIYPVELRGQTRPLPPASVEGRDKPPTIIARSVLSAIQDFVGLDREDLHQRRHDDIDPSPEPQQLTEEEQMFVDRYHLARELTGSRGLWERATMLFAASNESIDPKAAKDKAVAWLTGAVMDTNAVLSGGSTRGKHFATSERAKHTSRGKLRRFMKSFSFDPLEAYGDDQDYFNARRVV